MIRIEDLHKRLGGAPVLRGIDLEVKRGELVALVGPSGAGKSVLLKNVIGLAIPDRGRVLVDGVSVGDANAARLAQLRRRMGYVFQDAALLDWLDIEGNLRLGLGENPETRPAETSRARVREALSRVNLPDTVMAMLPAELSGGMRKRVGVARAIVHSPDVLLYDEPTTGLDPRNVASIHAAIRRVRRELGATSVVVTHDMAAVAEIADRVVLMLEGRVRFDGPPGDFFAASGVVAEFIGVGSTNGGEAWRATPEAVTS